MTELLPYLAGLAAVAGGFVALGKLAARVAAAEAKQAEDARRFEAQLRALEAAIVARIQAVEAKAEALSTTHHAAQAQLAKDLEAIRITLARIEASLAALQKAA